MQNLRYLVQKQKKELHKFHLEAQTIEFLASLGKNKGSGVFKIVLFLFCLFFFPHGGKRRCEFWEVLNSIIKLH